jgi:hypothetical protein
MWIFPIFITLCRHTHIHREREREREREKEADSGKLLTWKRDNVVKKDSPKPQ